MGKDGKKRATCEICSKKHPSLLHSKRDENTDQEKARPEKGPGSTSGHPTPQEDVSAKTAGVDWDKNSALAFSVLTSPLHYQH